MIRVGKSNPPLRIGAASHRRVAAGDEDQVPFQLAVFQLAAANDGRLKAKCCPQRVQRRSHAEQLRGARRDEQLIGMVLEKLVALLQVNKQDAPMGMLVFRRTCNLFHSLPGITGVCQERGEEDEPVDRIAGSAHGSSPESAARRKPPVRKV